MGREAFAWAPVIALVCGAVAGLGALHSARRAFGFALGLGLVQTAAWMVVLMAARAEPPEVGADWNADLWASFVVSLLVVTPYTALGAVLSGAAAGLLRRMVRRARKRHEDHLVRR
jgi:hypothetical protein